MKVEQLMARPVHTCSPNDTLQIPAQLMWNHEVGSVVVQREGKIVGMLTDRDICIGALTSGQALWEIPVSRSMTPAPVTIHAQATVDAAEQLMREKRVRRLPVVDELGHLVGLLSLDDVAREALRQYGKRRPDVSTDGVVGTLGTVAEPRKPQGLSVGRDSR